MEVVFERDSSDPQYLVPEELRMTATDEPLVGRAPPENILTQESRRITVVNPGASCEADLETDRLEGPNLIPEDPCMVAVQ